MSKVSTIEVARTIRSPWSTAGYETIVQTILGTKYRMSLVLIGDKRARTLNKRHRHKDVPANVLSFPLSRTSGEVFLNVPKIKREASRFGLSPAGHGKYLLVHAALHLKGHTHGSTMEQAEEKLLAAFNIR